MLRTNNPAVRRASSAVGSIVVQVNRGLADPERIEEARRDLRAAKLLDYAEQLTAGWPPLTAEQADKIITLLRPGTAGGT